MYPTNEKEEPLVVNVKDILTGEVTTQKMQPDRVWNLEKNKKIMVELNGDGQGSDNGSNLLVKFLGKLSQKLIFCLISVVKWDKMPEVKTRLNGRLLRHKVRKMREIEKNSKFHMPVVAKAMQEEVVKWSKNWEGLCAEVKLFSQLD